MTKNEISDALRELVQKGKWGLYRAVPSAHCFYTLNIPQKNFDGGDLMAFCRHIVLEINIFFRDEKTEADFELENAFEKAVAPCGEFSAVCGYDPETDCYFTQYKFELTEEI